MKAYPLDRKEVLVKLFYENLISALTLTEDTTSCIGKSQFKRHGYSLSTPGDSDEYLRKASMRILRGN